MSTAVGIRFLGGRYHATPWDRHVNEADVEWPPSPLRLLRALIATWHRKADRDRYGEGHLGSLVHQLAADAPVYRLPPAVLAHARHYMPVRSGRLDKPVLVFDAFIRVDPAEELLVVWPETSLAAPERELLSHLLELLGYLGRAESWSEARLLETWSDLPNCGPEASKEVWGIGMDAPWERLDLAVAAPPFDYASWRADQIRGLGLERPRLKREKRLAATLPERLIDALSLETAEVRDLGWSRAPGTDRMAYLRPETCFGRERRQASPRSAPRSDTTTARLALLGKPLPRLEDSVRIGEAVRKAAISQADRRGASMRAMSILSGHDMPDGADHQHAFYLPEDADGDGRIDHVTIHAAAGVTDDVVDALSAIPKVWWSGDAEWPVVLDFIGAREEFRAHPYLAFANVWESVTPYLHPWFRKPSFGVEAQIRRELEARGLPSVELERLATVRVRGRERRPGHFHRIRSPERGGTGTPARRHRLRQPDTQGSFWRLTFSETVPGPIALGFGCHFGLGLFRAITTARREVAADGRPPPT